MAPAAARSRALTEDSVLETESLCAAYGNREVLHGFSVSIEPGKIVALIGPNGAGKSTALRVIAGLLRQSSGRIYYQGKDIGDSPAYRRARMGIATVLQGGPVFASLTPKEHMTLASRLSRERRARSEDSADYLLAHLETKRNNPAGLLSGGERQALAVMAALASEPQLLLCDEPSAGLAPAAADGLLRRVASASRERGLPVLWVEQRVAAILPLADRALLMRRGEVVAETDRPILWLDGDTLRSLTFGRSA